jgi:anthranilate synthase component 1
MNNASCSAESAAVVRPVIRRLSADLHSPVSLFLRLAGKGPAFLLESSQGDLESARWSFIGFDPRAVITCRPEGTVIQRDDGTIETVPSGDPLPILAEFSEKYAVAEVPGLPPFRGGAVGYLSYEAATLWERLPRAGGRFDTLPLAQFMVPGTVAAIDRLTGTITLVSLRPAAGWSRPLVRETELLLSDGTSGAEALDATDGRVRGVIPWTDSLDRAGFEERVGRILGDIREGEIIQAVLSLRRSAPVEVDPFTVYRYLRLLNPSPYLFFLRFPEVTLAGSSPEMMVRLEGDAVTTKPIAGTRPRGQTPAEDRLLIAELLASDKEKAEHAMLVDLARNDIGRVCRPGSVRVEKVMEVESFSHVHHLVSRVTGRLREGRGVDDLVRATFPAGTVSGAPKLRAMEIIAREEPVPRGPYAGLVGYRGPGGSFDSGIIIRSAVFAGGEVRLQAGAGIVADSDPGAEYREVMSKLAILVEAVERAQGGKNHAPAH